MKISHKNTRETNIIAKCQISQCTSFNVLSTCPSSMFKEKEDFLSKS